MNWLPFPALGDKVHQWQDSQNVNSGLYSLWGLGQQSWLNSVQDYSPHLLKQVAYGGNGLRNAPVRWRYAMSVTQLTQGFAGIACGVCACKHMPCWKLKCCGLLNITLVPVPPPQLWTIMPYTGSWHMTLWAEPAEESSCFASSASEFPPFSTSSQQSQAIPFRKGNHHPWSLLQMWLERK